MRKYSQRISNVTLGIQSTAVVLSLCLATAVQAQIFPSYNAGPIPLPADPSFTPQHIIIDQGPSSPGAPGGFMWGDPNNPVSVSYDPTAGPIEKWLKFDSDLNGDGAIDLNDLAIFAANPIFNLQEFLVVGPGPAWTDWHEEILTPDWEWGNVQINSFGPPPGPTNLLIQQTPTTVDFYFDPLPPGTQVDIRKQLVFAGNIADQAFQTDFLQNNLMVKISEHPTVPEPSGLVLAACGVLGLCLRRSRQG